MRITDQRYAGEMEKFELAIRMIGHEARTGTIRACTGFTEDRVRKLFNSYFVGPDGLTVRRRRGKTPRQIEHFVRNSQRQAEATLLGCLFVYCGATRVDERGGCTVASGLDRLGVGQRLCQAFETYRSLSGDPALSFEWAWNLYHSLVESRELFFARCDACTAAYVQDRYALDYQRCPSCDLKRRNSAALAKCE